MSVFYSSDFKAFIVTGVDADGKRVYRSFGGGHSGWLWANGINLYRGTVWGLHAKTGTRQKLKRVWN